MRMKKKTKAGKMLTLVIAAALAAGILSTAAYAAIDEVSLTVKAAENFEDEAAKADFEGAKPVVDLYLVASSEKDAMYDTYNMTLLAPYADKEDIKITDDMDNDDWLALADAAALTAKTDGTPIAKGKALGTKIDAAEDGTKLAPGLYLAIIHGEADTDYWEEAGTTIATGEVNTYHFSPLLIHLPTKLDENGDGVIKTSVEDGSWIPDASMEINGDWAADTEVVVKYTHTQNYGDLLIRKHIENFEGPQATFVFRVQYKEKGVDKERIATIHMTQSGMNQELVVKLPAGAKITVIEEYDGARFKPVGSDTVIIESLKATQGWETENIADFENEPNGHNVDGYGIENHFEYSEENGWSHAYKKDPAGKEVHP